MPSSNISMQFSKVISFWNPLYRNRLFSLLIISVLASLLIYFSNSTLEILMSYGTEGTSSFSVDSHFYTLYLFFHSLSASNTPFIALSFFLFLNILYLLLSFLKAVLSKYLEIDGLEDIENNILHHSFSSYKADDMHHSVGIVINRLSIDARRASSWRVDILRLIWCFLLIFSNLFFFAQRNLYVFIPTLLFCVINIFFSLYFVRRIRTIDNEMLTSEDRVKSLFTDYLFLSFEIAFFKLANSFINRFSKPQKRRSDCLRNSARWNAGLSSFGHSISVLSLVFVLFFSYFFNIISSSHFSIVPVVIWSIPMLLKNTQHLVMLFLELKLSQNSIRRLSEFESHLGAQSSHDMVETSVTPYTSTKNKEAVLSLEGVTFRYPHTNKCIFENLTTSFVPGKLYILRGDSGVGKSSLFHLLTGYLTPNKGSIRLIENNKLLELSDHVTFLPQDPVIINSSIIENIWLETPDIETGINHILSDSFSKGVIEGTSLYPLIQKKSLDGYPTNSHQIDTDKLTTIRKLILLETKGIWNFDFKSYETTQFRRPTYIESLSSLSVDLRCLGTICQNKRVFREIHNSHPLIYMAIIDFGKMILNRSSININNYSVTDYIVTRFQNLNIPHYANCFSDIIELKLNSLLFLVGILSNQENLIPEKNLLLNQMSTDERFQKMCMNIYSELGLLVERFSLSKINKTINWRENFVFSDILTFLNESEMEFLDNIITKTLTYSNQPDFLETEGLKHHISVENNNLSGGQKQIIAITRALLRNKRIILLDEPSNALDSSTVCNLLDYLDTIKNNKIVIIITHDKSLYRKDSIILELKDGQIERIRN